MAGFGDGAASVFADDDHDNNNVPLVVANDAFHDVSDVRPFHLPHIWNNCTDPTANCTLNVTTVTMPM